MKKYRVPVQFTYMAYVDVEADSPDEAWNIVTTDLDKDDILDEERGVILTEVLDWDYDWLDKYGYDYFIENLDEEITV